MKQKTAEFIEKLAQLCTEYRAELGYTTYDDGVHDEIGDDDICIGFPMLPDPGADIRKHVAEVQNETKERILTRILLAKRATSGRDRSESEAT